MKLYQKIFLVFLFFPLIIFSQENNHKRETIVTINEFVFILDSFSIVPNSLNVFTKDSNQIQNSGYLLNEIDARIKILDTTLLNKSLIFNYSVYPVLLSKNYYHRTLDFIEPENNKNIYWKPNTEQHDEVESNLTKEGEISRKITLGNSQNLSVLSNIDLRISGELSDNIRIQGVISDNNLPFQEDGSSYKLQEFDKVYIRIYNDENELITGDIELRYANKYLKYKKKTQGLIFSSERKRKNFIYKNNSSISMSKGRYATNTFLGVEGNQGPYKLTGNNDENYIVILSGTEKVFIDGQKLKRGNENDYIIDYNTSEIIFTNNLIITKDKRIYIEFEYNDRSYAQSVMTSNHDFENSKTKLSFSLFTETDWKNQNHLIELSNADKILLSNNGDETDRILSNSIDSVEFSADKVLYRKIDTTIQNFSITYYQFSANPNLAKYQIRFTKVNQNEGDYILSEEGINGKIYKWIPPLIINNDFISQGNYTPKIQIISPKSKTIISTSLDHKISNNLILTTNLAFEYHDKNLFSDLDDNDNMSIAASLSLGYNILIWKNWGLRSVNSIEYINERFEGVSRYKDIEFNRNWNINSINSSHLLNKHSIYLLWKEDELIQYDFQHLKKGENYSGIKNTLNININREKTNLFSETNYSLIKSNNYNSTLIQFDNILKRNIKNFNLFITSKGESILNYISENEFEETSQSFLHLSTKLSHNSNLFSISITNRKEKKPGEKIMEKFSNANEANLELYLIKKNNLKYRNQLIYRNLHYYADTLTNGETLLNNNTLTSNLFNNFINININYELGKGREAKKEKSFIKVPVGMGTHSWIDNNNNSIQELNEFVIALFQDEAEYVQLYLPSTNMEDIYLINYSQNITSDFKQISKKKFLKQLHVSSVFQLKNKNKINSSIYNPFSSKDIDSSVNYMSQNLNTLSYNRLNKKFSLQIINKNTLSQNSFSYGKDKQQVNENKLICNLLLYNLIKIRSEIIIGEKETISDFFESKNFSYSYQKLNQQIIIKKGNNSELSIKYIHQLKYNLSINYESINNNEESNKMMSNEISILYNYKIKNNSMLESENKLININFSNSENSILNYELLEGLSDGINFVWSISYKRTLKNNLSINLAYNGRKSQSSDIRHIGNMGIQAYF